MIECSFEISTEAPFSNRNCILCPSPVGEGAQRADEAGEGQGMRLPIVVSTSTTSSIFKIRFDGYKIFLL